MTMLWGALAAQVVYWPSAGVALLVCIVIGLAVAALAANRRGVAEELEAAEPDPLAIPHHTGASLSAHAAASPLDAAETADEAEPVDV